MKQVWSAARVCAVVTGTVCALGACPFPFVIADAGPEVVDDNDDVDDGHRWVVRAPIDVGPRQETAVVAFRDEIVVIGGFDENTAVVDDVTAYNPATDTWRDLPPLPFTMHHAHATVVDESIFVTGGLVTLGFTASRRAARYDRDTDAWTEVANLPPGTERGGGATVARGGIVVVIGGIRGGNAVDDVSAYDPQQDTWTTLPSLPAPRDHLVAAVIDDVIYAVGGRRGAIGSHAPNVYALSPSDDAWTEVAPLPTSRGGMAAAVVDNEIFVFGGEGDDTVATRVFDDVESYDPRTDTWTVQTPMPTPRHGMGAAAIGNIIYIPGGATVDGLAAVATHEALVVDGR